MSKPGLCCDDCFDLIAKRSTAGAKLWIDLCEIQDRCKVFAIYITDESPLLQLLEHLGFITTTDTDEMTIIKVNGKEIDHLGTFFCGGNCGR